MRPRPPRCLLPALLASTLAGCTSDGPTTTGPEGMIDPAGEPRIVATYPADGSTGPFNLYVPSRLGRPHFIVEMNRPIVRSAFLPSWVRIEGFEEPIRAQILVSPGTFPPEPLARIVPVSLYVGQDGLEAYEVGRTYSVTVDTAWTDFSGKHLAYPHRFSFTPEPYFRVVRISPQIDTTKVDPYAPIAIDFNSPIDAALAQAVQVRPDISGKWSVRGSYRLLFSHLQPFPYGGQCLVSISSAAADVHGNRLQVPFRSQFGIEPFGIEVTYPADGGVLPTPNYGGLTVRASTVLDSASVWQAFHIEPHVTGELRWIYDSFDFRSSEFALDTRYTVTISTALRAHDGTPLPAPFVFSIRTAEFEVLYTYPRDQFPFMDRSDRIEVACNARIDTTSVREAFSIAPAVGGRFGWHEWGFEYRPDTLLAARTIYSVTVSEALRSQSGAHLAQPYHFEFRTGP